MDYLKDTDFKGAIGKTVLAQLRGDNDENVNEAEQLAISELAPLRGKFDIDKELLRVGEDRNKELTRMMVSITSYYLYNTVVDKEIPERIENNYDKELKDIRNMASGKQFSTLTGLQNADGTKKTNFRAGGDAPRDHNPW